MFWNLVGLLKGEIVFPTGCRSTHVSFERLEALYVVSSYETTTGLEWRIFHILTSEDFDDVISRFETVVCAKKLLSSYITKRKLHGGSKI